MNLFPHVSWSRSASIYEVNVRQYTPEGTLKALSAHLPRLQKMGTDILWLMPVQPIGQLRRKGKLGSYYAVADYTSVNPEFGTMDDLCMLVKQAHGLGMKVILDWVANHTAWDHVWTRQHPEWYLKNERGEIHSYLYDNGVEIEDWSDVCGLDYQNSSLWLAMTEAMLYWLREADIDGFRCDVAGLVPMPFWEQARNQMEQIKPVFMLAEWADPGLHAKAFDMTYDWELYEVLKKIAKGQADARDLSQHLEHPEKIYPADAYRMTFTANHDTNSWHGHDAQHYGAAFRAMAVLAATLPGMPLIYSGQESGLHKQLQFFDKDTIDWGNFSHADFYAGLLHLKKTHPALRNGAAGGALEILETGLHGVFRFQRRRDGRCVRVTVNLSSQSQSLSDGGVLSAWAWEIKDVHA